MHYEQLKAEPHGALLKMAAFCGLDASQSAIDNAVSQCSMEKLRAMEKEHPPSPDFRGDFFRNGNIKQWPEWFDDKDMRWFVRRNGRAMHRLGYL